MITHLLHVLGSCFVRYGYSLGNTKSSSAFNLTGGQQERGSAPSHGGLTSNLSKASPSEISDGAHKCM